MQPLTSTTAYSFQATPPPRPCSPTHPLEENAPTTPAQVAAYFPQSLFDIGETLERDKARTQEALDYILAIPQSERSFANTFLAADEWQAYFHSRTQAMWVVSMTHSEKTIRDAAKEAVDEMRAFSLEQFLSNKALRNACLEATNSIAFNPRALSTQQLEHIKDKENAFQREGLSLPEADFQEVLELKKRIGQLETSFLKNLDEESSHLWLSRIALDGVPQSTLSRLEQNNGLYQVTCDAPTYYSVMSSCHNPDTRKQFAKTYGNHAKEQNEKILAELFLLREQLAHKLGYASFAEYDISDQTVGTPAGVEQFIEDLTALLKPKAEAEINQLLADLPLSVAATPDGKISPDDLLYLYASHKQKHLNIEETVLQEYFPFDSTLTNLLDLFQELFALHFEQLTPHALWSGDLKMLAVYNDPAKTEPIGHVILDLFPREGKFSHGYCVDVLSPSLDSAKQRTPAIAAVLTNFTPPQHDRPSLLLHSEVVTLFHELGHCLHQLLGLAEMPTLSGYHVKTDFLELPSQLLEELLWEPGILNRIARHYQTEQPIPEKLLQDKIKARTLSEGLTNLHQMALAHLSLHNETNTRFYPHFTHAPRTLQPTRFRHLADPLYRTKYYSYAWAEVYAKDLYDHLRHNPSHWLTYRHQLLEAGGSLPPDQLLTKILGRKPSLDAYHRFLNSLAD